MPINLGILGFAHGHVGVYVDQWLKMSDAPVRVVAGWDHDRQRLRPAEDVNGLAERVEEPPALFLGIEHLPRCRVGED